MVSEGRREDDHYKAGKEIGELTGEVKLLTAAIGNMMIEFREFKNGVTPHVQAHDASIATLETEHKNTLEFLKAVNGNIKEHIEGHWKWIAILIGVTTLFGVLVVILQKLGAATPSMTTVIH